MADLFVKTYDYPMYDEIEKVIRYWDKQIEEKPQEAQAFLERGKLWFILKEYQKAAADFDQTLLLAFDNSEALEFKKVIEEHLNEKELPMESINKLRRETEILNMGIEAIVFGVIIFVCILIYGLVFLTDEIEEELFIIFVVIFFMLLYVVITSYQKKFIDKHYQKVVNFSQNVGYSPEINTIIRNYIIANKESGRHFWLSIVISVISALLMLFIITHT